MSIPIVCLPIDEHLNKLFLYRYNIINENDEKPVSDLDEKLFKSFVASIKHIKSHNKLYANELLYDLVTEMYSVMDDNLMNDSQLEQLLALM